MLVKKIVVGPLQCNCMILGCEKTREAIVVDPGDEHARILAEIEPLGLNVKYLLHTHAHFDHVGATRQMHAKLGAKPCLHRDDEPLYNNLPMQGRLFGLSLEAAPKVEKFLEDDEILSFGEYRFQVIHTPGHSPGGVCFRLLGGDELLLSGDTLFQGSVGRTDLWGGDSSKLISSIKNRLLVLDGDTKVQPGHGPDTLIGIEKRNNPFLN
jgi:hydroxyacylglutathione hydrolase